MSSRYCVWRTRRWSLPGLSSRIAIIPGPENSCRIPIRIQQHCHSHGMYGQQRHPDMSPKPHRHRTPSPKLQHTLPRCPKRTSLHVRTHARLRLRQRLHPQRICPRKIHQSPRNLRRRHGRRNPLRPEIHLLIQPNEHIYPIPIPLSHPSSTRHHQFLISRHRPTTLLLQQHWPFFPPSRRRIWLSAIHMSRNSRFINSLCKFHPFVQLSLERH